MCLDEDIKSIHDIITYGSQRPDLLYKKKWLGYVRFQGEIVRISQNYGYFFTAQTIEPLPENLKSSLRTCAIIQPDFRRVVVALLTCNGLIQGFTNSENIAYKLVEFLEQLPVVIPNEFFTNCCRNLKIISKIIKMTAIKFRIDKGKTLQRLFNFI